MYVLNVMTDVLNGIYPKNNKIVQIPIRT